MDADFESRMKTKNKEQLDLKIKRGDRFFKSFEYDHTKKMKVCKHYLQDRCYRDDDCDYAHEIVPSKMPDCKFYENCTDYFCHFKHRDERSIMQGCPDFIRGVEFAECNCKIKGAFKHLCSNYAAGFCPDGPKCPNGHPKWSQPINRAEINSQAIAPCRSCHGYHLAVGLDQEDCDLDRWCRNSCCVLYQCHGQSNTRVEQNQQWFFKSRYYTEMCLSIIRAIERE